MQRILIACIFASAALVLVLAAGKGAPTVRAEDEVQATYTGPKDCKTCHLKQHKSWTKSNLAKAFEALKPGEAAERKTARGMDVSADHTRDPACLRCHVTGYGQHGGYPEVGEGVTWTPEQTEHAKLLEGVSCESCHGPGSLYGPYKKDHEDYKRAEVAALGMNVPVESDTCAKCHEKVCPAMPDDYAFDAAAELEKAKEGKVIHEHFPLKKSH